MGRPHGVELASGAPGLGPRVCSMGGGCPVLPPRLVQGSLSEGPLWMGEEAR